jgi:hypothetical protein
LVLRLRRDLLNASLFTSTHDARNSANSNAWLARERKEGGMEAGEVASFFVAARKHKKNKAPSK